MLEIYIGCLVLGFILLGAEIYVPGGILGTLGALALLGMGGLAVARRRR